MLKFYIDSSGSQGVGIVIWDTKHRNVQKATKRFLTRPESIASWVLTGHRGYDKMNMDFTVNMGGMLCQSSFMAKT